MRLLFCPPPGTSLLFLFPSGLSLSMSACMELRKSDMGKLSKTWLWMQIWLAIKPNLKCTQFGKFKKEYEDKIAEAEANIGQALDARATIR